MEQNTKTKTIYTPPPGNKKKKEELQILVVLSVFSYFVFFVVVFPFFLYLFVFSGKIIVRGAPGGLQAGFEQRPP